MRPISLYMLLACGQACKSCAKALVHAAEECVYVSSRMRMVMCWCNEVGVTMEDMILRSVETYVESMMLTGCVFIHVWVAVDMGYF
jgi:hypothetical protein